MELLPFCEYHFDMFCLGEALPEHIYIDLGVDRVLILRAHFPRTPGGGAALGAQYVLPGFCVWCKGPDAPDDLFRDMEERPGGPTTMGFGPGGAGA